MLIRAFLIWCLLLVGAAAAGPAETMFQEAENLARSKQQDAAMAKAEQAITEVERAHAAGEKIEWGEMNGFRWTAALAREAFLDYEKSLDICDRMLRLADTDYWRVPARLEKALTYRAMHDYEKAQKEYDAIALSDDRQRSNAVLPMAEMVYFDIGDEKQGRKLIEVALLDQDVNGGARFKTIGNCAKRSMSHGRRDEALQWYAFTEKLPFDKAEERDRYLTQALFEMGKIQETRGRMDEAKSYYRRAMNLENGDMRYRTRARDALENIEYFE